MACGLRHLLALWPPIKGPITRNFSILMDQNAEEDGFCDAAAGGADRLFSLADLLR
jgi:hypothetical protein